MNENTGNAAELFSSISETVCLAGEIHLVQRPGFFNAGPFVKFSAAVSIRTGCGPNGEFAENPCLCTAVCGRASACEELGLFRPRLINRRIDGSEKSLGCIAGGAGVGEIFCGLGIHDLAGQILQGGLHQRVHGGHGLA